MSSNSLTLKVPASSLIIAPELSLILLVAPTVAPIIENVSLAVDFFSEPSLTSFLSGLPLFSKTLFDRKFSSIDF